MREPIEMTLQEDYLYCEKIIKKHSKSFYYAFSKLPKEKAQAIYAIYTFCRYADDTVDTVKDSAKQRLNITRLENELKAFESGNAVDTPMWRALTDVFERFDMDIEPFYDQLKGQKMDIDFVSPETLGDLEEYSYYVAGTVGLMLLPIIARENKEAAKASAISLGVAMQITNILRDVGEDWKDNKRVYLPNQILSEEKFSKEDLIRGQVNDSFIRIWENLAHRAESLYDSFRKEIQLFDKESQLPVLISADVYRGILNAVRRNQYNCLQTRNYVSPLEMNRIQRESKRFLNQLAEG
ncbi:phytoene/squalene synthase family protein [Desemzia incerta]|uniref:phytoene/squalene synthase family protein n=1 Tax=Desemzia incerta TaxID=82801 RepID=UPI003314EB36